MHGEAASDERRVLMVQLNRYEPTDRREAWSELVFWEAEPALVDAFYDMWRDVNSDVQTRAVEEGDIVGPRAAVD